MTIEELEKLAKAGNTGAMNNLAMKYEEMGQRAIDQRLRSDYIIREVGSASPEAEYQKRAIFWWKNAAQLGDGSAKINLGLEYMNPASTERYARYERELGVTLGVKFDREIAGKLWYEVLSDPRSTEEEKNLAAGYIKEHRAPDPNKKGGCYIATCVYGSYDCPEVWTLRRYRDRYLAQCTLGKLFIRVYYCISPRIVWLFGCTKWFHYFNKSILDRVIRKLHDTGFSDNPYFDY